MLCRLGLNRASHAASCGVSPLSPALALAFIQDIFTNLIEIKNNCQTMKTLVFQALLKVLCAVMHSKPSALLGIPVFLFLVVLLKFNQICKNGKN